MCILTCGPEYKIRLRGKVFVFEFPHHYGGPAALTKRGDIATSQPGYFLDAASLWHRQGRRVTQDGFCVWTPAPTPILRHIVGNHYIYEGDKANPDQC
jgi:hypothetical protein